MQAKFERGDNSEVTATSAYSPEQIGVFGLTCPAKLAIRRDHLNRQQIVDGHAVLATQPTITTTGCQAANPGCGHDPGRNCKTKSLGLMINVAESCSALNPSHPCLRIDAYAVHQRQVDHQSSITDGITRRAVTTPANRGQKAILTRKIHALNDVGHAGATRNQGWAFVDHAIENASRFVVSTVLRGENFAPDS